MARPVSPPRTQPGASPLLLIASPARARRPAAEAISLLFAAAALVLIATLGGSIVYDEVRRAIVRPKVMRAWPAARRAVEDRLKQEAPAEFGGVWATRSGMICGLVNGWGSFGGLIGMTPFAVQGRRAVFAADIGPLAFAPYWRRCIGEQWIIIRDGPMQPGFCSTELGQAECRTVTG